RHQGAGGGPGRLLSYRCLRPWPSPPGAPRDRPLGGTALRRSPGRGLCACSARGVPGDAHGLAVLSAWLDVTAHPPATAPLPSERSPSAVSPYPPFLICPTSTSRLT